MSYRCLGITCLWFIVASCFDRGSLSVADNCIYASVQPCGSGSLSTCGWANSPRNCAVATYYHNLGPTHEFLIPHPSGINTGDGADSFSWGPGFIPCYFTGQCEWIGDDKPIYTGYGPPVYVGMCIPVGNSLPGGPQELNLHGQCE